MFCRLKFYCYCLFPFKVGDGGNGVSTELETLKKEFMQCEDANEKAVPVIFILIDRFVPVEVIRPFPASFHLCSFRFTSARFTSARFVSPLLVSPLLVSPLLV